VFRNVGRLEGNVGKQAGGDVERGLSVGYFYCGMVVEGRLVLLKPL
jgi:hypothetical protein